jgi:hypothetical protein
LLVDHTLKKFRDHISGTKGSKRPNIQVKFAAPLKNLGFDQKYKSKSQKDNEHRHYADIEFIYNIKNRQVAGDFVVFDGAFLDLTMKRNKEGHEAENCLETWCSFYLTGHALGEFNTLLIHGTGFDMDSTVATEDKRQNLYSFTASMSTEDPPVFNYYIPILDESDMPSGCMRLAKGDTIPTMCINEDNQKIYCGSIILGMSASIFVPEGSNPDKSAHLITPRFELLGCRIYGEANNVSVVELKKKKKRNV